jgi:putative ABC transport system permease protein
MDRPFGIGGRDRQATLIAATPSIFRVTGVSVLRGRPLEAADMASASEVAVISEQTARDLFGTIDVVGREMRVRDWPTSSDRSAQLGRTATIVGIAADTDTSRLFSRRQGAIYMPLAPFLRSGRPALLTVTARTPGDPDAVMARLRTATRFADPDLAIGPGSSSGRVVLAGAYVNLGFLGILLGSLGALAVVLSTAGLYGVLSHVTARRTREIGLRMALGAGRVRVMRLVLTDGLRPVVEGILIGLVVATAARVILHYVTEGAVAPVGVVTSVLACLPLVLAALLACYLPARRAAGIEPNQALREL